MSAEQPTVLPWHRAAAKETCNHIGDWAYESGVEPIAAIISRHDPAPQTLVEKKIVYLQASHAETLRLLELSLENNRQMADTYGLRDDIELCAEIRAHLAAMKGTK